MAPLRSMLIISQVIPQWYVDVLLQAAGKNCVIDCITGSSVNGVNVIVAPQYKKDGFKYKLKSWIQYAKFLKTWLKSKETRKYDLILAVSNPPINAFMCKKLKKKLHGVFIYMNWDIFPQCEEDIFKGRIFSLLFKFWHRLNNQFYPHIDQMITIGNVIADSINLGLNLNNKIAIKVIPIAADTDRIRPIPKNENEFLKSNNLQNKFIILYSGNMSSGHNIDIIIDAADQLREYDDIMFVLIGDGVQYSKIQNRVKTEKLVNIKLFPWQSEEMYPFSIACGDVAIVTQEIEQAHLFMPSRTYSMMAAGEAIVGICTRHDDLNSLLIENRIGFPIYDNSVSNLTAKILDLYNDKNQLRLIQNNARNCAVEKFSMRIISKQYEELFTEMLKRSQNNG